MAVVRPKNLLDRESELLLKENSEEIQVEMEETNQGGEMAQ